MPKQHTPSTRVNWFHHATVYTWKPVPLSALISKAPYVSIGGYVLCVRVCFIRLRAGEGEQKACPWRRNKTWPQNQNHHHPRQTHPHSSNPHIEKEDGGKILILILWLNFKIPWSFDLNLRFPSIILPSITTHANKRFPWWSCSQPPIVPSIHYVHGLCFCFPCPNFHVHSSSRAFMSLLFTMHVLRYAVSRIKHLSI